MKETATKTFRSWLNNEITEKLLLPEENNQPKIMIWCDSKGQWKPILEKIGGGRSDVDFWLEDNHEIILREKMSYVSDKPVLIWLHRDQAEISYLKAYELEASHIWTESLVSALTRYGVQLNSDRAAAMNAYLADYTVEKLDQPYESWQELTPSSALEALVTDDDILDYLARDGMNFESLKGERWKVFRRRVTKEYGLPDPAESDINVWRINSVAALICTQAAKACPQLPPKEPSKIIATGPLREDALRLLKSWISHIELMPFFEVISLKADQRVSLNSWAREIALKEDSFISRAVESALYSKEIEDIKALSGFQAVANRLDRNLVFYQAHAASFWGARAAGKVVWDKLVTIAEAAGILLQNHGIEGQWRKIEDAIEWYTKSGWQVDQIGEILFCLEKESAGDLTEVLHLLRKTYQKILDAVNQVFSELVHDRRHEDNPAKLPYAGQRLLEILNDKEATAVFILDACRFDLAKRIADRLNQGEPELRADVQTVRAPVPSITALGMAFALPVNPSEVEVDYANSSNPPWIVKAKGFSGNLAIASERKSWLKKQFGLSDDSFMEIRELIESKSNKIPSPKKTSGLLFISADEFDDHDEVLRFTGGIEAVLDRYAHGIRLVRDKGYVRIVIVTDHGFYHWEPEKDEIIEKPGGDLIVSSRRYTIGCGLMHDAAIELDVPGSEFEVAIPRSVGVFKAYGQMGFFHGGATLQELIIPFLVAKWPQKAKKIPVVLKPVNEIASLAQYLELQAGAEASRDIFGEVDKNYISRQVTVRIVSSASGLTLFKGEQPVSVQPGGAIVPLPIKRAGDQIATRNDVLKIQLLDADTDEILDERDVTLKIDLDAWD